MNECKHPRVQIVSREEDAEFVECLECGEIFEASEFKDMAIEDSTGTDIEVPSDQLPLEIKAGGQVCSVPIWPATSTAANESNQEYSFLL